MPIFRSPLGLLAGQRYFRKDTEPSGKSFAVSWNNYSSFSYTAGASSFRSIKSAITTKSGDWWPQIFPLLLISLSRGLAADLFMFVDLSIVIPAELTLYLSLFSRFNLPIAECVVSDLYVTSRGMLPIKS